MLLSLIRPVAGIFGWVSPALSLTRADASVRVFASDFARLLPATLVSFSLHEGARDESSNERGARIPCLRHAVRGLCRRAAATASNRRPRDGAWLEHAGRGCERH